jgi:hypothetical protein
MKPFVIMCDIPSQSIRITRDTEGTWNLQINGKVPDGYEPSKDDGAARLFAAGYLDYRMSTMLEIAVKKARTHTDYAG